MLSLLKDLISQNPFVEELEFQDRGIDRLDAHTVEILSRFSELSKISLQDNDIRRLPADLSQLAQIREINLSGNPLENLQKAVESLATMPQLDSL
jgi:Leucine-rich repeat (LRR) protein